MPHGLSIVTEKQKDELETSYEHDELETSYEHDALIMSRRLVRLITLLLFNCVDAVLIDDCSNPEALAHYFDGRNACRRLHILVRFLWLCSDRILRLIRRIHPPLAQRIRAQSGGHAGLGYASPCKVAVKNSTGSAAACRNVGRLPSRQQGRVASSQSSSMGVVRSSVVHTAQDLSGVPHMVDISMRWCPRPVSLAADLRQSTRLGMSDTHTDSAHVMVVLYWGQRHVSIHDAEECLKKCSQSKAMPPIAACHHSCTSCCACDEVDNGCR